jgi:hypothetical protein
MTGEPGNLMTSKACCFTADTVSPSKRTNGARWRWFQPNRRGKASINGRDRLLWAALLLPSLLAEIAPLIVFWNDHLPIWEMPVMMAAIWAATWWVT